MRPPSNPVRLACPGLIRMADIHRPVSGCLHQSPDPLENSVRHIVRAFAPLYWGVSLYRQHGGPCRPRHCLPFGDPYIAGFFWTIGLASSRAGGGGFKW